VSTAPEMLRALGEAGAIEPLDLQLASTLVRRSAESSEGASAVALAIALASRAYRDGHSGITIAEMALQGGQLKASDVGAILEGLSVTDEKWLVGALAASSLASDGARLTPLVVRNGLLQFWRYFDAERRIAARIQELTRLPAVGGLPGFSIITGGPGTGKTTMVARKLVELKDSEPALRIALAAPTGKAAARLTESIRRELDRLEHGDGARTSARIEARTLHRLLGYSPRTDTFRSNQTDPLDDDLVIVDEASMVDVLVLDALLRALKPGARVVLVGDHNQLASVEAGDVLGELCRAALSAAPGSSLHQSITVLTTSWRFAEQPAIGTLAAAILVGDADAVFRACSDRATPQVRMMPPAESTDALLDSIVPNLERCLSAASPDELLDALDSFRILAPEREGRLGVQGINDAVERWLARRGHPVHEPWYHGRPVLVTANDYATGVFNGDLGVVWREAGTSLVHFRSGAGTTRSIAPVRLPSVQTAWAMTVHKAQGSEFQDVLVVVPEHESRVMSRELLYTAVTRAQRGVTVIGSLGAVKSAIGRSAGRTSGLGARMAELFKPA
jgi:exodeoxyribonuclease V alpha subunit